MTTPHVEYVAHHWIVLAAPAFLPAVIVVAVILYVALRDRRAGPTDDAHQQSDTPDKSGD
ncbi:hypothetical protein [Mycobacterium stomatepiae]|uniref:Uncharacterized protein n=1 Tax=Mycobacterium stomatepiae TaxID=470076 RepID=A0A7I7Q4E0_9MYCO|nr:hypothetical protein [Mycobacterium stomatepiae]MCV7168065.1 hypothetical protein [Mycobacterium stomatepiae]BBY20917.1 hypothetical protein MSTO_11220 [Mycobacterium stomatepiae]